MNREQASQRDRLIERIYRESLGRSPACSYEFRQVEGWNHDTYRVTLPMEPPGAPIPGGPWEIAQRILREYQFSDPTIISHVYFADSPLALNAVLLNSRFLFLNFLLAVRVGRPVDGVRESNNGPVRVWGYNYQALKPHLERGQLLFQVVKWLDSGDVQFQMQVYSRRAHIPNPIYRLGYILLGRWQQKRFGRRALHRMWMLVRLQLAAAIEGRTSLPLDGPTVCPASRNRQAAHVMERLRERYGDGDEGAERALMVTARGRTD